MTYTSPRFEFANTLATQLAKRKWFIGDNAPCRLYANVPGILLQSDFEEDLIATGTVDLVVCSAEDDTVLFSVDLDCPNWNAYDAEPPFLPRGLMSMTVTVKETTAEYIGMLEARICGQLRARLAGTEPLPADAVTYKLPTVSMEDVAQETGETLRKRLVQTRILSKEGTITTYGRERNIFERYKTDGSGQCRRELTLPKDEFDHMRDSLLRGQESASNKNSLAKRLARLERGFPTDGQSGAYAASALQQLLQTPLEKLYENDPAAFKALTSHFASAKSLLWDDSKKSPVTYIDALKTVSALHWEHMESDLPFDDDNDAFYTTAKDILHSLARQLLAPLPRAKRSAEPIRSLQERLKSLPPATDEDDHELMYKRPSRYAAKLLRTIRTGEYPILGLPIAHYFYAAAMLDKSDYPLWLYEKTCKQRKREIYPLNSTGFKLQWFLGEVPSYATASSYYRLYDIMVEPMFPNIQ